MAYLSRTLSPYERQREARIKERKAFVSLSDCVSWPRIASDRRDYFFIPQLQELFPKDQLLELKRDLAPKPKFSRPALVRDQSSYLCSVYEVQWLIMIFTPSIDILLSTFRDLSVLAEVAKLVSKDLSAEVLAFVWRRVLCPTMMRATTTRK